MVNWSGFCSSRPGCFMGIWPIIWSLAFLVGTFMPYWFDDFSKIFVIQQCHDFSKVFFLVVVTRRSSTGELGSGLLFVCCCCCWSTWTFGDSVLSALVGCSGYGLWRCKYNVWKTQTWIFNFLKSNIYFICHRGLLHLQVLKKFLRENRGHSRPQIDNGKRNRQWKKVEKKWGRLFGKMKFPYRVILRAS